jgi:hypothetical protein
MSIDVNELYIYMLNIRINMQDESYNENNIIRRLKEVVRNTCYIYNNNEISKKVFDFYQYYIIPDITLDMIENIDNNDSEYLHLLRNNRRVNRRFDYQVNRQNRQPLYQPPNIIQQSNILQNNTNEDNNMNHDDVKQDDDTIENNVNDDIKQESNNISQTAGVENVVLSIQSREPEQLDDLHNPIDSHQPILNNSHINMFSNIYEELQPILNNYNQELQIIWVNDISDNIVDVSNNRILYNMNVDSDDIVDSSNNSIPQEDENINDMPANPFLNAINTLFNENSRNSLFNFDNYQSSYNRVNDSSLNIVSVRNNLFRFDSIIDMSHNIFNFQYDTSYNDLQYNNSPSRSNSRDYNRSYNRRISIYNPYRVDNVRRGRSTHSNYMNIYSRLNTIITDFGSLDDNIPNNLTDVVVSVDNNYIDNLKVDKLDKKLDYNCAICMDCMDIDEMVIKLPCEHIFHEEHIKEYLKKYDHICPLCRKSVGNKHYNI